MVEEVGGWWRRLVSEWWRRYTTLHHTTPHHITPHHTTPHHTTPHHATPHHATPHHATPHHATEGPRPSRENILELRSYLLQYVKMLVVRGTGVQDDELQSMINYLATVNEVDGEGGGWGDFGVIWGEVGEILGFFWGV